MNTFGIGVAEGMVKAALKSTTIARARGKRTALVAPYSPRSGLYQRGLDRAMKSEIKRGASPTLTRLKAQLAEAQGAFQGGREKAHMGLRLHQGPVVRGKLVRNP